MKRSSVRLGLAVLAAIVAAVLVPVGAANAATTNYYVDPVSGSDTNAGTSISAPFKTIAQAQATVRTVNVGMNQDIVVNLRGGTYSLTSTLNLTAPDSGFNGHKVIYQAYAAETPVISSGRRITGWTAVGNGQYVAPTGGLDFRQLYINGSPATLDRFPDIGSNFQLQGVDNANKHLNVLSSQVSNWANFSKVELVTQLQWAESILRLSSYTTAGTTATLSFQNTESGIIFQRPYPILAAGSPFYFQNAKEFLNQPGEFYVDTNANQVYYIPRAGEDMSTADIEAPTLETLVNVSGSDVANPVQNVQFHGITFAQTTWMYPTNNGEINGQGGLYNVSANSNNQQYVGRPSAGVYVSYATNVVFSGNKFTQMGATALDLHHGVHTSSVIGNLVTGISGNGIMVGKFSDPSVEMHTAYNPPTTPAGEDVREVDTGITVSDNLITQIGLDYPGTAGINAGFVNSTTITHNDISDVPWAAISLGWAWTASANALGNNNVSYNRIGNALTQLCDTAGIYHLSNDPGSVINNNYVHDLVRSPGACTSAVAGLYLDEGTNNMTVSNNVLSNTDGFIVQNHNGSNNTLTNNQRTGQAVMAASGLEPAYVGLLAKINLAYGKPTSASSIHSVGFPPSSGNDNNPATGWSPTGADTSAWWQTDLGSAYPLREFSLTLRRDFDQPETRSGFEVRASNDPTFATYTVVGRQDQTVLPYGGILTAQIASRTPFRYIRIAKTDGQYFYVADFSVQAAGGELPTIAVPTFNPATYYTIKNVNSGLVADVYNNSTASGGNIDQYTPNGGDNQKWQIIAVSGNLFKIVSKKSGLVLGINGGSHGRGVQLQQFTWNGANNQLWWFEPVAGGAYVIHNWGTAQVVEVAGASTAAGAAVEQWMGLNQTNQQWTIQ